MRLRAQAVFPIPVNNNPKRRVVKMSKKHKKHNKVLDIIQKIWYNVSVLKRKGA